MKGSDINTIQTPALLVDMNTMERNLQKMASFLKVNPVSFVRTLKTISVLHLQKTISSWRYWYFRGNIA